MGRVVWITSGVVGAFMALAFVTSDNQPPQAEQVVFEDSEMSPDWGTVEQVNAGPTGSAIATAAFGLSALQPETFNRQIVIDIIEASPLGYGEKDRLTAKLMAADAGRAKLPSVLEDIRVSLAVE
ncbi:MAG: hypothetical protein AAF222_00980 [Pseudomonadota bacterium]